MRKGKHEASGGGWRQGGDPFAEEVPSRKTAKKAASGGWDGRSDPFAEAAPAVKTKKKTGKPAGGGWKSFSRGRKAGIIAGGCVLAVVLLVVGWWSLFVKAPDVSDNDRPVGITDNTPSVQPGDTSVTDPEKDGDDEPAVVSGRKEDVYTFLLLGKDTAGGGNTDTIILVTYDVPNGTVNCMSIPRDTMVNVNWDIKRVNSVYMAKESSGGGIEGLKKQIGLLTGITPDFHVIIEWKAVGLLVEELGGVEFDVPYNMDYDDPYQNLHIHQKKGLRKLSGDDAMQVVRWRKNSSGTNYGDTVRMEVQQAFLKAVAKQCLQLKNWTKISGFAKIFFENVETDLPLNNLLWFAQNAMGVDMDNLSFVTMPGEYEGWAWSRTYYSNQSYVFAYPDEIVKLVNESFNPYSRDITTDDLQIMYKNRDGSLGITHGTILDTKATSAPAKASGGSGSSGGSSSTKPSDTQTSSDEPTLPSTDTPTVNPGTTTNPGTMNPGTTTNPGTTQDPGTTTDPGTEPDPGTTDPGVGTDPGTQPPADVVPDPQPDPQPEPDPQPAPDPGPAPELPPEPELPPGE